MARVGNSPNEYFLGPETPGASPRPEGGFKDRQGRIKRQGARFRVYGMDADGRVVAELTSANAEVSWTVHIANAKAAWYAFEDRYHFRPEPPLVNPDYVPSYPPVKKPDQYTLRRNAGVADRASLVIDPGPRTICGRSREGADFHFDTGTFLGVKVPLGELRTDASGRLIVLGGFGKAASVKPNNPISTSSFNNDSWHDDISDGTVAAKVRLADGRELEALAARVVVAPPDFAPELDNIVTLYDVMTQTPCGPEVSFTRDVYPLLRRASGYQWVSEAAGRGHGPGRGGDLLNSESFKHLKDNSPAAKPWRDAVFARLRAPVENFDSDTAKAQANFAFMPQLGGDAGSPVQGDARTWLHLTGTQYEIMTCWAAGNFVCDWSGAPQVLSLEELPLSEQPQALVKAALESCVGGGFHPGIEITYIVEHADLFAGPLRFKPDLPPGDITKYMALPWHGDFFSCHLYWWPAQRPEVVITEADYAAYAARLPGGEMGEGLPGGAADPVGPDNLDPMERGASELALRTPWDRGLLDYYEDPSLSDVMRQENAMVDLWSQLGFVVSRELPWGERLQVETEREPFAGINVRDIYYRLQNIDENIDVLPKARWLVCHYLKKAWEAQSEPDFPESYRYFEYSSAALDARMEQIYDDLVIEAERYDPALDQTYRTREDVLVWLTQMAPFNQNDGAWIRRVTPSGPLSEVDALLFDIWMDEAGDGKPQWSHCNLYTNMLHGLGMYFHDVRSREYAFDPRFFDSAF
ncbi:MAG TPA: LodA/GoxA family CTQ-dependent oxidase, partial [Steroidobacteraceae bacterium]